MGTGIAIAAAKSKRQTVVIFDKLAAQIETSKDFIDSWIDKKVTQNVLSDTDRHQMKGSLHWEIFSPSCEQLKCLDFVIEAVPEVLSAKQEVFRILDAMTPPDVILASNTSSISIAKIASVTNRPGCVVGMHFMNPVPVIPLVEIVKGSETYQSTVTITQGLADLWGKVTATVLDRPGFISNRLLMPYINEAAICLEEVLLPFCLSHMSLENCNKRGH
eukprot:Filipodium_phascolosomae@DN2615_c0_g1_i15.p1